MRKVLIIVFLVVVAGALIFLIIKYPEAFKKIYLWLIGLFGVITWPLKKLWNWMNAKDELNEIEQNNKLLKQELEQIKKDLALARNKLETERSKNKLKIEELESKISAEDQKGKVINKELETIKGQTLEEFNGSLTTDERKKLQDDTWKDVDFGL